MDLAVVNPLSEWDAGVEFKVGGFARVSRVLSHGFEIEPVDVLDSEMCVELEAAQLLTVTNPGRCYLAQGITKVLTQRHLSDSVRYRLAARLIEMVAIELQRRFAIVTRASDRVRTALIAPT